MSDRRDTQWPRFEVFLQEKNGRSHKSVGSVHAPDAEMAMLNARDLFGRRPDVINLWVAAADHILAKTAEELAQPMNWQQEIVEEEVVAKYLIFQKQSQRRAMTFVMHTGEVMAQNAEHALQKAIEAFHDPAKPTFVWWVCPESAITRSEPEDIESLFSPALEKHYKHPYDYKTFSKMRKVRKTKSEKTSVTSDE